MKKDLSKLKERCEEYNNLVCEDVYACEVVRRELRLYRYGSLVARGKVFCFNYINRRLTEEIDNIVEVYNYEK